MKKKMDVGGVLDCPGSVLKGAEPQLPHPELVPENPASRYPLSSHLTPSPAGEEVGRENRTNSGQIGHHNGKMSGTTAEYIKEKDRSRRRLEHLWLQPYVVLRRADISEAIRPKQEEPDRTRIKEEDVDKEVHHFNEQMEQKFLCTVKEEEPERPCNVEEGEDSCDIRKEEEDTCKMPLTGVPVKRLDEGQHKVSTGAEPPSCSSSQQMTSGHGIQELDINTELSQSVLPTHPALDLQTEETGWELWTSPLCARMREPFSRWKGSTTNIAAPSDGTYFIQKFRSTASPASYECTCLFRTDRGFVVTRVVRCCLPTGHECVHQCE
nr:uncharacterized protein LOC125981371 isoform X42 [Syngnathus scovelli]